MKYPLKNLFFYFMMGIGPISISSCKDLKEPAEHVSSIPNIFPDYCGVTIPQNIAPLNFMLEDADHVQARFLLDGQEMLAVSGEEGVVDVPDSEWHLLLSQVAGKRMQVEVAAWDGKHPDGLRYKPFDVEVSKDSIDPWIAYRLIEPGYEPWRYMGIYERNLSSFEEVEVISNKKNKDACINCHHFDNRSAKRMMFHVRGEVELSSWRMDVLERLTRSRWSLTRVQSIQLGIPRVDTLPFLPTRLSRASLDKAGKPWKYMTRGRTLFCMIHRTIVCCLIQDSLVRMLWRHSLLGRLMASGFISVRLLPSNSPMSAGRYTIPSSVCLLMARVASWERKLIRCIML